MRGGGRRRGALPRDDADRLLARGPRAAGRRARRRRARARHRGRGHGRPAAADRHRRAAAPPQPDLQLRRRHPPRRDPRRRPEVLPADLPRVLRGAAARLRRRRARRRSASAGRPCRSAPTCCSPPRTCPASSSTPRSARTCGSRSRRAPRRRWRARPSCSTCPAARSPSAGPRTASCCAARPRPAAWPPTSTPPPARASRRPTSSWDGQTMIYENGVLLAETERFKDGDRHAVADVDLDLLRQERRRMGTFDDNRRAHAARRLPPRRLHARSARRRHRAAARASSASRSCPPTPTRLDLDCYEAYNIQVAGLQQRLRRDRRPEGRDRRLRRARLDACAARRRPGDGPRRPPAQRHPRLHAPRLRHQRRHQGQRAQADAALGVTAEELDITPTARADARGDRPPVRARRGGLRRHLRERPGRPAHGLPVPDRQPARRDRARHRRPVGARARLGHLRRRRPDEPLQRQRRRAQDVHPAPDPLGDQDRAVRGRRCRRR